MTSLLLAFLMISTIQVHGHRGARAVRPENTLPAFEYAIAAGVDALELDMAVTKDGVLVVSHDPILHAPVCHGPQPSAIIHNLTLAELGQWDCGGTKNPAFPHQVAVPGSRMPTLDQVFDLASKGHFLFNIETKIFPNSLVPEAMGKQLEKAGAKRGTEQWDLTPSPEDFVRLVLEQVRKHHLEKRVILQSFDFRTLQAMHQIAPSIKLSALTQDRNKSYVAIAKEAGASIVSPEFRTVTPEKVAAAHAAGLQVVPWTPDTPADWDRMISAKVDAIITDDPAALLAHLGR